MPHWTTLDTYVVFTCLKNNVELETIDVILTQENMVNQNGKIILLILLVILFLIS